MKKSGFANLKKRFSKKNILTVPNIMSLFRLVLIPVAAYCYFKLGAFETVLIIALSALTDVADGFVARHFDMVSDIGKILDPIADKLTLCTLAVCLCVTEKKLIWLIAIMAIREVLLTVYGFVSLRRHDSITSSKWYGKACTVILYASFIFYIVFPDADAVINNAVFVLCMISVVLSLALYTRMYIKTWAAEGAAESGGKK